MRKKEVIAVAGAGKKFDPIRCAAFFLPPLLLLLNQYIYQDVSSLYPDARLYLSIADNFLSTGHFIQTERAVEIVVPFAYPLYLTLLRAVKLPVFGFFILNLLSVGVSSVFLYDTERELFGRGGFSCAVYTAVLTRADLPPFNLFVEYLFLFLLCWLVRVTFRKDLPLRRRIVLMNVSGFLAFASRPVLAPVYAAVLAYSLYACVKHRAELRRLRSLAAGIVLIPLAIFGINTAVNYRETGEIIPISNYGSESVCFALNPNSTVFTSENSYTLEDTTPEVRAVHDNNELSLTEKGREYKVLLKEYLLHNTGHIVSIMAQRGRRLFFRFTRGLTVLSLLGAVWMALREPKGERRLLMLLGLLSAVTVAVLTSAGIYEPRYILPIWPIAAVHTAALPNYILDDLRRRRARKGSASAPQQ